MPAKPKIKVTSLSSSARLEGPWGAMELRKDQVKGTLVVARHEDPKGQWSDDGGGQHALLSVINDCEIVELNPGDKRPCLPFPNDFLDFLIARPEFAPDWMKKANAVFFYELNPPKNHQCGAPTVRGISFTTGEAREELRLDRAFGSHDRVAMFWSDDPMSYELFSR